MSKILLLYERSEKSVFSFSFFFFFFSAQKLILPVDFYSDTTISSLRYYHVLFMCLPALIILAYPIYEVFLQAVAQEENVVFFLFGGGVKTPLYL